MPGTLEQWARHKVREYKDKVQDSHLRRGGYCWICGARLNDKLKCPNCGDINKKFKEDYDSERSLFRCPYCGNNIMKIGSYCQRCGEKIIE